MAKRFLSLLLALLVLSTGAFAFEKPDWLTQMEAQGVQGTVSGELTKFSPFTGATMKALQNWAQNSLLSFQVSKQGQGLTLSYQDQNLLSFRQDASALYLSATSQEYVGEHALERLLGIETMQAPDIENDLKLYEAIFTALDKAATALMPSSKEHQKSVELKNIGRGYRGDESTLDLTTLAILRGELAVALRQNLPLEQAMRVDEMLDKFILTKPGTFRTLMNRGEVVGYQLICAGEIAPGDERDISLLFARSQKGVDIRIAMPDKNKENNIVFNLSAGFKTNAITVDADHTTTVAKKSDRIQLKVSLNFQAGLKGTVTYTQTKAGQKPLTLKLSPSLVFKEEALTGTLTINRTQNDRSVILKLYPTLRVLENPLPARGNTAINLDVLDEEALLFERQRAQNGLTAAMLPLVAAIAPEDQTLVMHELTRHLRLSGDDSLSEQALTDSTFLVEE